MKGGLDRKVHSDCQKRGNVTMPSINAACLSSVEFTWEAGKQELRLLFLSAGLPATPATELLIESKDKSVSGLLEPTGPDRFSGIRRCPHSHPQKKTAGEEIELRCKIWHRQSGNTTSQLKWGIRKGFTPLWQKITTTLSVKGLRRSWPTPGTKLLLDYFRLLKTALAVIKARWEGVLSLNTTAVQQNTWKIHPEERGKRQPISRQD